MKTPEDFADELRSVQESPERGALWRRRVDAISERDAAIVEACAQLADKYDVASHGRRVDTVGGRIRAREFDSWFSALALAWSGANADDEPSDPATPETPGSAK